VRQRRQLAQLIGCTCLAIGREVERGLDHRVFGRLIHPVRQIGLAPCPLKQRFYAAIIHSCLVAVKRVARHAHDLAGLAYVAQLFSQVQKARLVFDDLVS